MFGVVLGSGIVVDGVGGLFGVGGVLGSGIVVDGVGGPFGDGGVVVLGGGGGVVVLGGGIVDAWCSWLLW